MVSEIGDMNDTFREISLRSLPLRLDLLLADNESRDNTDLFCKLEEARTYQWRDVRRTLNPLVLSIVLAWQQYREDTALYQEIRRQQRDEWPLLIEVLRTGCRAFSVLAQ